LGNAYLRIRALHIVAHYPRVGFTLRNPLQEPVKRREHRFGLGLVELNRKERGGGLARNRHPLAAQAFRSERAARDHKRTVAVAETGAARQQRVSLRDMRVGGKGERGDVVKTFQSPAIERLDVLKDMLKTQMTSRDFLCGQPVKHEGVVRVRTVRKFQLQGLRGDGLDLSGG